MAHKGFRDFLENLEENGEVERIDGAGWDLEMAGIAEIIYRDGHRPRPALMFDNIPGYPKGYRALFGQVSSPRRLSSALKSGRLQH